MFDPFKPANPQIPGVPAADPQRKKAAPVKAQSAPTLTVEKPAPADVAPEAATVAEPQKPVAPAYQRPPTRSTPIAVARPSAPAAPPPPEPAPAEDRNSQMLAIAICLIACALVAGMAIAWKIHQPAQSVTSVGAASEPAPAADLGAAPSAVKPPSNLPVAPGVVATAAELAKPWASKAFTYRDPINGQEVPALVVHLPQGGYWGFSMIEPFGACELEFVTNLNRLRDVYGYSSDHPMVGDPCNHAVFDLLQYGDTSTAQVRGAVVHGMGVRPPLAIEIEKHGDQIVAIKME